MSDINHKRAFVYDLSPHTGWKKKVSKMSDAQIIAIFLREQNKAEKKAAETKAKEDSSNGDIPF